MTKLRYGIKAEISNLRVTSDGPSSGSYEFNYRMILSGKKRVYKGFYSGSFSSRSAEAFRKVLKRGYALHLAMGMIFG